MFGWGWSGVYEVLFRSRSSRVEGVSLSTPSRVVMEREVLEVGVSEG